MTKNQIPAKLQKTIHKNYAKSLSLSKLLVSIVAVVLVEFLAAVIAVFLSSYSL